MASRLIIRIKIPSDAPPAATPRRRLNTLALILILVVAAVALGWFGITTFRSAPPAPPAPVAAPAVSKPPVPQPPAAAPASKPEPPTAPVNEVLPDPPQSALDTIHGTVRVSVRVVLGKGGEVLDATLENPGPSRYFARLALQASRRWTFTASDSAEQRVMLLKFGYTRAGVTARATPQ